MYEFREGFNPIFSLADISIPRDRLRELKDYSALAESIEEVGLLQPVTVTTRGKLVAGRHRVEAAKSLGWKNISAFVVRDDELKNRLAEIDENLRRLDLTVYEQSKHAEERERVLEAMGTRHAHGGDRRSESSRHRDGLKSTSDVAADAGMSESSYQRRTKIGRSLGPETRAVLDQADTEDEKQRNFLNSTTQLNTVADISNKRGDEVAAEVTERVLNGEYKNIYDAYPEYKQEKARQREKCESADDRFTVGDALQDQVETLPLPPKTMTAEQRRAFDLYTDLTKHLKSDPHEYRRVLPEGGTGSEEDALDAAVRFRTWLDRFIGGEDRAGKLSVVRGGSDVG